VAIVHISEGHFHRFEELIHAFEDEVVPVGREAEEFPKGGRVVGEEGHGDSSV